MKLVDPTDFEVLAFLADRGRNNAVNISTGLERNRSYINTRLSALANFGLVERVGPAENSGLYQLTDRGYAALEVRPRHGDDGVEFGEVIERYVEDDGERTDGSRTAQDGGSRTSGERTRDASGYSPSERGSGGGDERPVEE